MPWKVEKRTEDGNERWCVVKESDGETVACHDSEDDAKAQLAALYASEQKAADEQEDKGLETDEQRRWFFGHLRGNNGGLLPKPDAPNTSAGGAASSLNPSAPSRPPGNPLARDASHADRVGGLERFAERLSKRSRGEASLFEGDRENMRENMLLLRDRMEAAGDITNAQGRELRDIAESISGNLGSEANEQKSIGRAADALQRWLAQIRTKALEARDERLLSESPPAHEFTSPPNWLTKEAEQSLFERIWDNVSARLGRKDEPQFTGFKVHGNHFLTVYSNDFRDRDGEIFTRKAIDDYIARVDMGITPLPELWVWHAGKSTAIGSVDWVARHGHFTFAAGQFYSGEAAQQAKAYYTKNADRTGISHGFTYPAAKFDGKHYHAVSTFEISLLPRGTEANLYTSLEGVKAMALDERKLNYLKEVFGEEHATRILSDWDKRGKALEALEVEFKDFAQPDGGDTSADKQAVENADKTFTELVPDLMEGSAEAVTAALEAVKQVKAAREEMAALRREIAETKALVEQRPRASQSAQTVVETSHLSDTLQKQLKEQNTVKDSFWGTEVQITP